MFPPFHRDAPQETLIWNKLKHSTGKFQWNGFLRFSHLKISKTVALIWKANGFIRNSIKTFLWVKLLRFPFWPKGLKFPKYQPQKQTSPKQFTNARMPSRGGKPAALLPFHRTFFHRFLWFSLANLLAGQRKFTGDAAFSSNSRRVFPKSFLS